MDETQAQPERMIFLRSGESLTVSGLARKLKGEIRETSGTEPATDEDTAIAALSGLDSAEGITGAMTESDLSDFLDAFVAAWQSGQ